MIINAQKKDSVYKTEKKEIMPFDKAFQLLRLMDADAVRSDICKLLGISSAYFTMKKNGVRGVTKHEKEVITDTFKKYGVEILSETNTKNNLNEN